MCPPTTPNSTNEVDNGDFITVNDLVEVPAQEKPDWKASMGGAQKELYRMISICKPILALEIAYHTNEENYTRLGISILGHLTCSFWQAAKKTNAEHLLYKKENNSSMPKGQSFKKRIKNTALKVITPF